MTKEEIFKIIKKCSTFNINGTAKYVDALDYEKLVSELQQAINFIPCCTELCDCEEPFIEIVAEECGGCGMLIKGD